MRRTVTIGDFCGAMERVAPTALAQEWDNVGLLVGDRTGRLRNVLLAIDLTPAVVGEARRLGADLILAYHPPIFRPLKSLTAPSGDMNSLVYTCVRCGVAIYSTHTALDAAEGGTNDVLARLCGVERIEPLGNVDSPQRAEFKLVVFVPPASLETVASAMFDAGAGRIGDYSHCSFRLQGEGTFFGSASTNHRVGQRGRLERVPETRLECIVEAESLAAVVSALRQVHPYEEPAFDVYPLKAKPIAGMGRIGWFKAPTTLGALSTRLRKSIKADSVQLVGARRDEVSRVVVVAGACGNLPFSAGLGPGDAVVTGEIRHHDALSMLRAGASAIALGHWSSERPALSPLAERLAEELRGVRIRISRADRAPLVSP